MRLFYQVLPRQQGDVSSLLRAVVRQEREPTAERPAWGTGPWFLYLFDLGSDTIKEMRRRGEHKILDTARM